MSAKPKKETEQAPQESAEAKPLVMTISELSKLSDEEKQAFRDSGGTSIEG